MTKKEIGEDLKMAYAKKKWQEEMYNYVDPAFVDVMSYEMKATECKTEVLRKMYDEAEDEKPTKKEMSKFWSGYILSCMQVPVGVKKETAVGKQIGF